MIPDGPRAKPLSAPKTWNASAQSGTPKTSGYAVVSTSIKTWQTTLSTYVIHTTMYSSSIWTEKNWWQPIIPGMTMLPSNYPHQLKPSSVKEQTLLQHTVTTQPAEHTLISACSVRTNSSATSRKLLSRSLSMYYRHRPTIHSPAVR